MGNNEIWQVVLKRCRSSILGNIHDFIDVLGLLAIFGRNSQMAADDNAYRKRKTEVETTAGMPLW